MSSGCRKRRLGRGAVLAGLALCLAGLAGAPPAPAGTFVKHPKPVPILVYHHVQSSEAGSYLMYVSTWQFAAQLRYMHRHHIHPVTLEQVWAAWTGGPRLPRRPVVLTFDDGYIDQYTNAARLLRRRHYPAVLNLVVYNGTALTAKKVRRMIRWGWEVDSHTLTHPILTGLWGKALRRQLITSRRIIRRRFRVPADFFCYPGGDYDRRVARAVRAAGYLGAMTIRYGRATPRGRFVMPRIAVYWGESLGTFGRRMASAPRMVAPFGPAGAGSPLEAALRRASAGL